MAKQHNPPDDDNQRTFGFVRGHDRFRFGRPERVSAHWRRLPGPHAAPRPEPPRDEGPRVAAAPVITLSVTVNLSVAL